MRFVEVMKLTADMCPAGDLGNTTGFIEPIESRECIRLKTTSESGQMIRRMLGLPIRRICEPDCRRVVTASRPIIAHVSPQAPRLRFAVSRSQHWHRYVIGMD